MARRRPQRRTLDTRPGLCAEVVFRLRAGFPRTRSRVHGGGDAVAGLADVEELFDVFDGDLDRPAGGVTSTICAGLAVVSVDT